MWLWYHQLKNHYQVHGEVYCVELLNSDLSHNGKNSSLSKHPESGVSMTECHLAIILDYELKIPMRW